MAEGVGHQGHAAEDDERAEEPVGKADDRAADERAAHEFLRP
jgi:hypothetical protein